MKNIPISAAIALLISCSPAYAATASLVGEEKDGLNKICYYESAYGRHAITIRSHQICPLTIEV